MPDGCALITMPYVSKSQVANTHFKSSFEVLEAVFRRVNEIMIGVNGTADNQNTKLITEHSGFSSLLHCAPLPALIDKLHNRL